MPRFTPTEERIIQMLSDGMRHNRKELHGCVSDELSGMNTLQVHIFNIRQKLRPIGQDIVCEYYGRSYHYRHVRLLSSPYKE